MDEETKKEYEALKEKHIELIAKQQELANAHMRNSEQYYGVKRDLIKLGRELEDLKRKIDNIPP